MSKNCNTLLEENVKKYLDIFLGDINIILVLN